MEALGRNEAKFKQAMRTTWGVLALLSIFIFCTSYSPVRIRTLIIDAGHGGHDVGCHGGNTTEKEVTLAVALKLGKYVKANAPDVRVIYTRNEDRFIELYERAEIANRNNADVFISLHCNSGPTKVNGTESYAMGLHVTKENLEVAKRENAVILLEHEYRENYDGFDPKSSEAHIIFSLYQNAHLGQSLELAQTIEKQFKQNKRPSRGVKQAGFLVLYKTNMPSVLVETGFLTNKNEETLLSSAKGQATIAETIGKAFLAFKAKAEKKQ